ncbi:hypothetical protein [Mesorhizobium sp. CN2-181]|uniref:hypothetical protein n=1 Tax=Mesorhizobium yinganensis TaxID=3157707 RepID=UPI0032B81868
MTVAFDASMIRDSKVSICFSAASIWRRPERMISVAWLRRCSQAAANMARAIANSVCVGSNCRTSSPTSRSSLSRGIDLP